MAEVVLDDFRQVVQGNVVVSTSGSAGPFTDMGAKEIVLVINVSGTVTGTTPTLTYTLAEVDPGNGTTLIGNSVTGAAITATGTQIISLPMMRGSFVQVSWTVTGTTPVFNGVYVTLLNKVAGTTGIYDNNQNGPVAVKSANTAAANTDPALVVAISQNTPIIVGVSQNDTTGTGSLGALNAAVSIALAGTSGVGFQLAAGTLIGTITPEISYDGGTTWNATFFDDPNTGNKVPSIVFASSNTATARSIVTAEGTSNARVRVSAFTSGTATCNMRATSQVAPSLLYTGPAASTTQPPTLAQVGGWDGTTLRAVSVKAGSTAPVVGDQALVVVLSPNQIAIPVTTSPSTSVPTLTFGDVTLSSSGLTSAIRRTTYTEQSANFTGSVVSSSANDTSAGTGARTIKITYVDSTGATAGTETATLNGTTAVNLVTTTKCFIEKMEVLTVGSTASNVGTITLKSGAAGAGTTIWTIGATDNQTFGCHHYVVTGKTCNVTDATHGNNSSVSGGASVAFIRAISIGVANAVEKQVSDFIGVGGATNQVTVAYGSTIQVAGPARLTMYVTTSSASSITYRGAVDCYDA